MAARTISDLLQVTPEQVARARRIETVGGEVYYLVANSKDEVDENGEIIEYVVRFVVGRGFSCTCAAGLEGFRNCGHHGTCWHCRAAYTSAQEFKSEQARGEHVERLVSMGLTTDQAKSAVTQILLINGREATDEELCRVWGATGQKPDREMVEACERRYNGHPFQLMR